MRWAIGIMVALIGVVLFGGWAYSGPSFLGPASDHFDGKHFHNLAAAQRESGSYVKWMLAYSHSDWKYLTDASIGPPPPRRVNGNELRVTPVNHATVLIQTQGLNILTDPIWSERASPFSFIGPARYCPPGIRFEDLPPIDVVLISHNHYDHLDLPTLKRLAQRDQPLILIGLGNRKLLNENGIQHVEEIDWWQTHVLNDQVKVTGVPGQHFSARGLFDRDETLWLGYVLQAPGGPLYFAGDTGLGPHFDLIRERFGPMRLAMLPIGAYLPRWFMKPVHMSPGDAIAAHKMLKAQTSLGIHYGTFRLALDAQFQARDELHRMAKTSELTEDEFITPDFGQGQMIKPLVTSSAAPARTMPAASNP